MCGRYALAIDHEDMLELLRDRYEITNIDFEFSLPRYNIAPSQKILCVINNGNYQAGLIQWGLIPFFAKDEKYKIINAKSETITTKPSFKNSFKHKRCIILASNFYEWTKNKTPMLIKLKNHQIFSFAGIWSTYQRSDQTKQHTCSIITTAANHQIEPIHDRMPVILTQDQEKIWLNPNQDTESLIDLLQPSTQDLITYPINTIVNNPRNQTKECLEPMYINTK